MAPLNIGVTGDSKITRAAERGLLHIRVSSTSKSQNGASEDVTRTCNKLREIFHNLSPKTTDGRTAPDAAVTQFTMSAFSTNSHVPRNDDGEELAREFTASARFTAIFRDFEKLGEVTSSLFSMPRVEIERTEWRLSEPTIQSLGSESRKAAMRDAIRQAKDYGEVVERNPIAVKVEDCGSNSRGVASQELWGYTAARNTPKSQVNGISLKPEDVELKTSINVTFQAD